MKNSPLMAHIFLIVEGPTEELFYKRLVQHEYRQQDGSFRHYFEVVSIPAKRNVHIRTGKGGLVSYTACVDIVRRFLRQAAHCEIVVLVLDYYGLHDSFKTHLTAQHHSLEQKIEAIQGRLEADINAPQFKFRLQVHEFEAYLFSKPEIVANHFEEDAKLQALNDVLRAFGNNPELINDNLATAPSKRLNALFPKFRKTTDGLAIAEKTGISNIRASCHWFNQLCGLFDALP